jgi:hypothetical protein
MNLYVDNAISFRYPEDFISSAKTQFGQYSLVRGDASIFLWIIRDDFTWKRMWQDVQRIPDLPPFDTVVEGVGFPGGKMWTEDFAECGFEGKIRRFLSYNHRNELADKHILLAAFRGPNRITVHAGDRGDFSEDILRQVLESIAFPGEGAYSNASSQGPRREKRSSPNAVELVHLLGLGRRSKGDDFRVNTTYEGDSVSEAQTEALAQLVHHERIILEKVKKAVFQYYTECIYPLLKSVGLYHWEESEELFSQISRVNQIVPMIELVSVIVHEQRQDGIVPVGLCFGCDWDPEHGLGVRMAGQDVEAVGADEAAMFPDTQDWRDLRSQ